MENKSSNGWKFFALFFGALLAAVVGLYIYKQQNPDYDPWEEPWENSSSPVDLGLTKDADKGDADEAEAVIELHLLHGDLDTPAVFASQAQGRAPLPFRERPCHDIPGTALAVQLIPGRYPAADTQGGQQRGVFQTDRDAALVPFPHHGGCFHPHPKPFSQEKVDREAAQRQNQQRRQTKTQYDTDFFHALTPQ